MTLEEAYEKRRQECLSLDREVKKLTKQLEAATKGLFTPFEKADFLKQVSSLKYKLKQTEKDRDRYHNMWMKLQNNRWGEEFKRTDLEIRVADLTAENAALRQELDTIKTTLSLDPTSSSKMKALEDEILRLNSIINNNGTNSGTPTSQTPLDKNKVIPNSREKTDHTKGSQPEHGGELIEAGERHKDEADYEVRLIKKRHIFKEYIELLNADANASDKFWELEKRIRKDKRKPGVIIEMSKQDLIINLVSLINDNVIGMEDLEEFSDGLKETVKIFIER